MVLQIQQRNFRIGEFESVALTVGLNQFVLDNPISLAVLAQWIFFDLCKRLLPHPERLLLER